MKSSILQVEKLHTERLTLIPYTTAICTDIQNNYFDFLDKMGLKKGISWPDSDVLETLPKIINNLSKVSAPTGFESWMIIKNETSEIIGDIGFKGFNEYEGIVDIGYGIIYEERRCGYADEAARVMINWAFENNMVKEITVRCLIENVSSVNLLKKLKFKEVCNDTVFLFWSLPNNNGKGIR